MRFLNFLKSLIVIAIITRGNAMRVIPLLSSVNMVGDGIADLEYVLDWTLSDTPPYEIGVNGFLNPLKSDEVMDSDVISLVYRLLNTLPDDQTKSVKEQLINLMNGTTKRRETLSRANYELKTMWENIGTLNVSVNEIGWLGMKDALEDMRYLTSMDSNMAQTVTTSTLRSSQSRLCACTIVLVEQYLYKICSHTTGSKCNTLASKNTIVEAQHRCLIDTADRSDVAWCTRMDNSGSWHAIVKVIHSKYVGHGAGCIDWSALYC